MLLTGADVQDSGQDQDFENVETKTQLSIENHNPFTYYTKNTDTNVTEMHISLLGVYFLVTYTVSKQNLKLTPNIVLSLCISIATQNGSNILQQDCHHFWGFTYFVVFIHEPLVCKL